MTEGADPIYEQLDYGDLGVADAKSYHRIIQNAVDVHVEREKIRHGLWKQYTALDQVRQAKIKIERMFQALEYVEQGDGEVPTVDLIEEAADIINYTVFAARILKGEVDV